MVATRAPRKTNSVSPVLRIACVSPSRVICRVPGVKGCCRRAETEEFFLGSCGFHGLQWLQRYILILKLINDLIHLSKNIKTSIIKNIIFGLAFSE